MTFTLAADGPTDEVLLPIIVWSLKRLGATRIVSQWADFSRIPRLPGMEGRLRAALDAYPCDILFVHRDAEAQPPEWRRQEIVNALHWSNISHVPVVPVRMTEAWLLADKQAIRTAAGNPNGRERLNLPAIRRIEAVPDPKAVLREAIAEASGLNRRRRARLSVGQRIQLIPNYIEDYSPLLILSAFRQLQADIQVALGRTR